MTLQDIKYYQQVNATTSAIPISKSAITNEKVISSLLLDTPTLVADQVGNVLVNEYSLHDHGQIPKSEFFTAIKSICSTTTSPPTPIELNNDMKIEETKKLLSQMLNDAISIELKHAQGVDNCRQKDSERGNDVIPDYQYVNAAYTVSSSGNNKTTNSVDSCSSNDKVVQSAYAKVKIIRELIDSLKLKYQLP